MIMNPGASKLAPTLMVATRVHKKWIPWELLDDSLKDTPRGVSAGWV